MTVFYSFQQGQVDIVCRTEYYVLVSHIICDATSYRLRGNMSGGFCCPVTANIHETILHSWSIAGLLYSVGLALLQRHGVKDPWATVIVHRYLPDISYVRVPRWHPMYILSSIAQYKLDSCTT